MDNVLLTSNQPKKGIPMNEEMLVAKLEQLQGELLATQMAIRGLLLAHPDRSIAITVALDQIDRLNAIANAKPISDSTLDGIARARKMIEPRLSAPDTEPDL